MRFSAQYARTSLLALAALLVVFAPVRGAESKPKLGAWGVDATAHDTAVRPGDDFFRYANGAWLDAYQIPPDLPGTGSFIELFLQSEAQVKEIIEDAAAHPGESGSPASKIGTLYNEFVDTTAIETKGLAVLDPYLNEIRAAEGHDQIADLMATFDRVDGGRFGGSPMTPFPFFVNQDEKDPSTYVVYFTPGGLSLPDRDYYLDKENERFAGARKAYRTFLTKVFTLIGEDTPEARANRILELETKIAAAHWPAEEMRDRDRTYNPMTAEELEAAAPGFPWTKYLAAAGLAGEHRVIVDAPSAFTGMAKVFDETPVEVWKDFLVERLVASNAALLPKEVDDASFEFTSKALSGARQQRERWKRGVQFVNGAMGEAVGRIYVERHFSPEAKARVEALVGNLLRALGDRIDHLDWMSPATKAKAREKLSKFTVKVGYPDTWRDYSSLEVRDDDLLGNAFRARAFGHDRNLHKLGRPVDRKEWFMSPQMVNAYYNPSMNEIVFPAAILQPPFFDLHADDAVNYGAIGAVIGHEIGHGFDDQGRKSDGNGLLQDWWTEEDATRFNERAQRLVEEYNRFSPIEGMNVNGQLTLGENIGDLGGLEIAYTAYHLSLHGKEAPVIDGLTGDQRFFLGFAQIWKGKMRDQITAAMLASNPHSPVRYRVNGVVPNVDAWYDAFHVTPDDSLYVAPENRVHIW